MAQVDVAATLPPPSADILHYESGPLTRRAIESNGQLFTVEHRAEWDGTGWLVRETTIAPAEPSGHHFREGDIVQTRVKVVQDHGDMIQFLTEAKGYRSTFWGPRSMIVAVERP